MVEFIVIMYQACQRDLPEVEVELVDCLLVSRARLFMLGQSATL